MVLKNKLLVLERWLGGEAHRLFSRGLVFDTQHPLGSQETSVTLVPRYLIPSSDLLGHHTSRW